MPGPKLTKVGRLAQVQMYRRASWDLQNLTTENCFRVPYEDIAEICQMETSPDILNNFGLILETSHEKQSLGLTKTINHTSKVPRAPKSIKKIICKRSVNIKMTFLSKIGICSLEHVSGNLKLSSEK